MEVILSEPKLPFNLACRNLWNLYALDYESESALQQFSDIVISTHPDKLNEIDVAHTLRALSHFNCKRYECIEQLLKLTIRKADIYKIQTLADVIHSLAELEVINPTLMQITKQILLKKLDNKAVGPHGEPINIDH